MSTENHIINKYQYEIVNEAAGEKSRALYYLFLYGAGKQLLCALGCTSDAKKPAKAHESPNGHVSAEVDQTQMMALIDLLRNERPVYFSWTPETSAIRISTNQEPVGEEEVRKMFSFLYI